MPTDAELQAAAMGGRTTGVYTADAAGNLSNDPLSPELQQFWQELLSGGNFPGLRAGGDVTYNVAKLEPQMQAAMKAGFTFEQIVQSLKDGKGFPTKAADTNAPDPFAGVRDSFTPRPAVQNFGMWTTGMPMMNGITPQSRQVLSDEEILAMAPTLPTMPTMPAGISTEPVWREGGQSPAEMMAKTYADPLFQSWASANGVQTGDKIWGAGFNTGSAGYWGVPELTPEQQALQAKYDQDMAAYNTAKGSYDKAQTFITDRNNAANAAQSNYNTMQGGQYQGGMLNSQYGNPWSSDPTANMNQQGWNNVAQNSTNPWAVAGQSQAAPAGTPTGGALTPAGQQQSGGWGGDPQSWGGAFGRTNSWGT
jgi:hypothetical protein